MSKTLAICFDFVGERKKKEIKIVVHFFWMNPTVLYQQRVKSESMCILLMMYISGNK